MEFSMDDVLFPGDDDDNIWMPYNHEAENMGAQPPASSFNPMVDTTHGSQSEALPGDSLSGPAPNIPYATIDWDTAFQQANVATMTAPTAVPSQLNPHADFSSLDQPIIDWSTELPTTTERAANKTTTVPSTTTSTAMTTNETNDAIPTPQTTIDDFFVKNGASRPPVPCILCQRRRLQCLILQTTQDNPNPTKSCSSCVALFRECSLSGSEKRQPSAFETSQPVIGGLHGVSEDAAMDGPGLVRSKNPMSHLSEKRTSTRSVRKTRALRNWFINHLDSPYPSDEDKHTLGQQSGLSKSQVVNWFANARRRQRISDNCQRSPYPRNRRGQPQSGSPMPQSLLQSMSPLDRWRNSPPEEEAVSASDIQRALASPSSSGGSSLGSDYQVPGIFDAPPSSASDDSLLWQPSFVSGADSSNNSAASSCYSHTQDTASSAARTANISLSSSAKGMKKPTFQCTFCRHPFKKKYDWVRHERSVHLPGLDTWICSPPLTDANDEGKKTTTTGSSRQSYLIWRVGDPQARCVFCGEACPDGDDDEKHLRSHEFEACAEKPVSERSFARKDHLRQHLRKFHGCRDWRDDDEGEGKGGRKTASSESLLRRKQKAVKSRCGFCREVMPTWDERMVHLAAHFKAGLTMEANWVGEEGAGIISESEDC